MAQQPKRKAENARKASLTIQRRTKWFMLFFGVACFAMLFVKLYDLQINQHQFLEDKAVSQQTASMTINASRGTIYDRNGETLAVSATAETIFISPMEIAERSEMEDAATGEDVTYLKGQYEEYVARGLARILGLEEADLLKLMERTYSQFEYVAKKVEQDVADEVRRFINGEIDDQGNVITEVNEAGETVPTEDPVRLRGIYLQADSKRYYPYSALASHVIGFVNEEGGAYGTEALYNDELEGTAGVTVTATASGGRPLLYQYEQYYDAENGDDLVLTIDTTVQYALEKGLEKAIEKYDVENGATGIVMDCNTGALLGIASLPNYDCNNYSAIYDSLLQQQLELAGEEDYADTLSALRNKQWRNKAVNDTYEPGSTYKILTLAMALEEGVVTEATTFNCTGSVRVGVETIHCSKRAGHGVQDLKTATANSCNPSFINMGFRIGADTYYDYMDAFGLFDYTGVDLPGEGKGIQTDRDTFTSSDIYVACYSFGQTFTVTPLQLIAAQAACINGGYLYTPYVVEQVKDSSGNVISQHDATPVRQVISEETSATVREILEYVVSDGTGKNGQVAGYRIGGKTGTADKTGTDDVVVSFLCFAPADDPQIIMLLTLDTPGRDTGTYVSGGNMVAPTAGEIMSEILPYLGIEPQYTAEELVGADATVPNVVGMTEEAAAARLEEYGFTSYRTVGEGETVTDQTPLGGAIVPNNAEIILYMGEEKPNTLCTVPYVVGMSASKANEAITNAGLIMKVTGAVDGSSSTVIAISQDYAEGAQLEAGSVVEVRFGDTSVRD